MIAWPPERRYFYSFKDNGTWLGLMRLSKIRLNGFKSFVDATPVPLPGGITAIVGPNGCGKSNIIDAVRWVMGESSAKHLRGGSMADVIFSGSSHRKPVGQASIELVFDNSDGSLGGQYAGFNEIAVRRQVNRDGQSAYYLNGTRCRRRDITDVFLGTGLGPRSYSIIEQGTISRLIEAKPEELRGYLEEAAGISLYKERRRETERRMRDTHENLERLEDVRDEVARQLEKLSQQAQTAERYRSLKDEARQRQAELIILRLRALEHDRQALRDALTERDNALEAKIAEQRSLERDMEATRSRHAEDSDALNTIQGRYYQLGSEIARTEQRISHRREQRESSSQELARNREALSAAEAALQADREKQTLLAERIATLTPEMTQLDERLRLANEAVSKEQTAFEKATAARDELARERADAERMAQVERTRIEQLEDRLYEQQRRYEKLGAEVKQRSVGDSELLSQLQADQKRLEAEKKEQGERIAQLDVQLTDSQAKQESVQHKVDQFRETLADAQARETSLRTLQEAALGSDSEVNRWLEALEIKSGERLGEQIKVTSGWEAAVEVVLGDALQAIATTSVSAFSDHANRLKHGRIMLYDAQSKAAGEPIPAAQGQRLAGLVSGPGLIQDLLAFVYAVEDEAAAKSLLPDLAVGYSVVTRDGRWFGRDWLRIRAMDDVAESGVLARGQEIDTLNAQIQEYQTALTSCSEDLAKEQANAETLRSQHATLVASLGKTERELAGVIARIDAEVVQQKAQQARFEALDVERDELAQAIEEGGRALNEARERLQEADAAIESADERADALLQACKAAKVQVETARQHAEAQRDERQDIALRLESAQTAEASVKEAIERLDRQAAQLNTRNQELLHTLDEVSDSDESIEQERQTLLDQRVAVEAELSQARERLEEADTQLRALADQRSAAEASVNELREAAESTRRRDYEFEARAQTQAEQLAGLEVDAAALQAGLPDEAKEQEWVKALERLDQRIRRLGPINLAAIDEHKNLAERKGYLDEQQADLTEALETLQSAIGRIDRETRARFKATFDKVNTGLQRLFPRLFGGGQAYLEMTDDNLLDTGVTIMARPPGKRISNIHLLSGGEKALAAVSLVFAIFELNPAPFCMLDEVDAPLDEANVGRFCDLLREMSERVQFVVITHNKVTMEAASHLAGVTMAEPGVSRLVAVDVAAAIEMVNLDA